MSQQFFLNVFCLSKDPTFFPSLINSVVLVTEKKLNASESENLSSKYIRKFILRINLIQSKDKNIVQTHLDEIHITYYT